MLPIALKRMGLTIWGLPRMALFAINIWRGAATLRRSLIARPQGAALLRSGTAPHR